MIELSQLFKDIKQLPVLPILLLELMESFSQEGARVEDIAKKIGMDQSISAKVIRMANSAAYRRGNEVESIERAVIRLGFNQVRSIVVATSLSNVFPDTPGFDKNKFWKDTFTTASIAKALAKHANINEETAFTCAMMHNIGELLLQILKPEECSLIMMAIETGEPRLSAQRETFGFDYSQIGAELARRWNFSKVFYDAIEQQLDPLSYETPSKEAILIRLSVFASFAWAAGLPAKMIVARFPSTLTDYLNLNKEGLVDEFDEMIEAGQELGRLLAN
ncbi:HDOD domain-containing protein [Psychromonas antarctica]|jgi:HD-like signal output (HDOD) protein|uniref:HDOD domain-containing protein n=1 Tax=Psychromonas antarctica TaxID=67573 RepID=UPI001EE88147|nr:HDOD domain-containing protein [Psychromonas antarctica]MCG6200043.1 HDOD domain-containing protein [Psychromonas antarctica]